MQKREGKKTSQVGALGVAQSYITVSMVMENILPQFVGKESILMNQESAGT